MPAQLRHGPGVLRQIAVSMLSRREMGNEVGWAVHPMLFRTRILKQKCHSVV